MSTAFAARPSVAEAYRTCEDITRTEARNFFYGIRLLPPPRRTALCALYALARRIDDIGDGELSVTDKGNRLAETRGALEQIDESTDPVLVAVADAARRYPVPLSAFGELVDGVQMDVDGVTYTDFDALVVYCRRVAGSIGRLCLSVFGSDVDPATELLADQLGIALQQTNILRDVREDLMNGRVYLPQDELESFGAHLVLAPDGSLHDPDGRLAALLRHAAARAQGWYRSGFGLVPHLDRRSAACCLAMAGIYRDLLDRIADDPTVVYRGRTSLTPWQKARVATVALAKAAT